MKLLIIEFPMEEDILYDPKSIPKCIEGNTWNLEVLENVKKLLRYRRESLESKIKVVQIPGTCHILPFPILIRHAKLITELLTEQGNNLSTLLQYSTPSSNRLQLAQKTLASVLSLI